MPPSGEPLLGLQTPSDHALLYVTLVQDGALFTGFLVEFERFAWAAEGAAERTRRKRAHLGYLEATVYLHELANARTVRGGDSLRPRRYRARYLDCAIQGPIARQDADEAERARWIQVFADMLKATRTSMCQLLSTSMKLLGGGRTVSTLRSRVRVLRRFLSLLALNHHQVYPLSWLREKLEEPCSGAGLKNTYQAYSFLEEMAGVPQSSHSRTLSYNTCSIRSCSPEPPWSPFEAGASFLGRSPHSPETSGGGPRHSSVIEDVSLVVASPRLGHAEVSDH